MGNCNNEKIPAETTPIEAAMDSPTLQDQVREHHKKHGAFGMEVASTELLRNYSHEIWVGIWWGIAANLALVIVVAIGCWLNRSIQRARQRRRERMAKQVTKQQAEPLTNVRVEQPWTVPERSAWGAFSRAVAPPQMASYKPVMQPYGSRPSSITAVRPRLTEQPAAVPAAAAARPSSQLQSTVAPAAASKKPEPPAAAPGAASFYKGGGRSIYSAGDD